MEEEVINILKKVGAIITDSHIVLTSGRHTSAYINKDALYPHTKETSKICSFFAKKYKEYDIDVVAGPALGGIILSQWTAYHLTKLKGKEVYGVYTEKTESNDQVFKRGYDRFIKNKKVLVVEDLTATGGSVRKVVNSVRKFGGKVAGVTVMVNRDPELVTSETIGALFSPLAVFKIESFLEKKCPLCKKNIPINTQVGHGKEFLARKS